MYAYYLMSDVEELRVKTLTGEMACKKRIEMHYQSQLS